MTKLKILSIDTNINATTTSQPFKIGGKQGPYERGLARVTFVLTGGLGSTNGDTVQFQVGAASASGPYVQAHLDPFTVNAGFIDGSGDFDSVGAVNVDAVPGLFGRFVFRGDSNATSSFNLWVIGAIQSSAAGASIQPAK